MRPFHVRALAHFDSCVAIRPRSSGIPRRGSMFAILRRALATSLVAACPISLALQPDAASPSVLYAIGGLGLFAPSRPRRWPHVPRAAHPLFVLPISCLAFVL